MVRNEVFERISAARVKVNFRYIVTFIFEDCGMCLYQTFFFIYVYTEKRKSLH